MSRGTAQRNVRIPDDLWEAALAKAKAEQTTVSAVLVAKLRDWVTPPPTH